MQTIAHVTKLNCHFLFDFVSFLVHLHIVLVKLVLDQEIISDSLIECLDFKILGC